MRGAGDVATAVALRLLSEGFSVVCTELPYPTCLRRAVAFAEAVYEGEWEVEGVRARLARSPSRASHSPRDSTPTILPRTSRPS